MTKDSILDNIIGLAETAANYIGMPGAAAAVDIGKTVLDMIEKVKPAFDKEDQTLLEPSRKVLAEKVRAHAEKTASNLEG